MDQQSTWQKPHDQYHITRIFSSLWPNDDDGDVCVLKARTGKTNISFHHNILVIYLLKEGP